MADRCFWCSADPGEPTPNGISPHATWCPHYRRPPLPPGAYIKDGRVQINGLTISAQREDEK